MSSGSDIDNYTGVQTTQDDYNKAVARLRQVNPLQDYGWFIGHRLDGTIIYLPGSYLAGYRSVLYGNIRAMKDFLGTFGQLSDGTIAFLPSFNNGVRDAKNDLQTAIFAEAHRRTFLELDAVKKQGEELQRQIDELKEKLSKQSNDEKGTQKK